MNRTTLLLLSLSVLLLAACTPTTPPAEALSSTATTVETAAPTTAPSATATETPQPTLTATPIPTATAEPTASPSPTLTATPFTAFDEMQYMGAAYGPGGLTYLLFDVPQVADNYLLKVEERDLACAPSDKYDDVLICETTDYDPSFGFLDCEFYAPDGDTLLYSQSFYHVSKNQGMTEAPWRIVWSTSNNCPQRGETVTCETEWRTVGGNRCMIASCFDLCGLYYSIDTCSRFSGEVVFTPQFPGPEWDPLTALLFAP